MRLCRERIPTVMHEEPEMSAVIIKVGILSRDCLKKFARVTVFHFSTPFMYFPNLRIIASVAQWGGPCLNPG